MVQSIVENKLLATGIPGEFSDSNNADSHGAILNSASEANNVPGRVVLSEAGNDYNVGVAQDGNFAGILACPKTGYRPSLDAQAFLPNESQVEVATRGYLFVTLGAVAAEGDWVYYSDTDGTLSTAAPGATAPAGTTRLPGGRIVNQNVTAAGVGEIYFDIAGSTETPA